VADVAFQPGTLADVIKDLSAFLMPHAATAGVLESAKSA